MRLIGAPTDACSEVVEEFKRAAFFDVPSVCFVHDGEVVAIIGDSSDSLADLVATVLRFTS